MPWLPLSVIELEEQLQWNIENMIMIAIKHLTMNHILALNNPYGVDMLFEEKKKNQTKL